MVIINYLIDMPFSEMSHNREHNSIYLYKGHSYFEVLTFVMRYSH